MVCALHPLWTCNLDNFLWLAFFSLVVFYLDADRVQKTWFCSAFEDQRLFEVSCYICQQFCNSYPWVSFAGYALTSWLKNRYQFSNNFIFYTFIIISIIKIPLFLDFSKSVEKSTAEYQFELLSHSLRESQAHNDRYSEPVSFIALSSGTVLRCTVP